MTPRIPVGSVLSVALSGGRIAYVQYVGDGFDGDAVRVLPGLFESELDRDQISDLVEGDERFIAQTFLTGLLKLEGVAIVGSHPSRTVTELAPGWILSPSAGTPEEEWVAFADGQETITLPEYLRRYPGRNTSNMPETEVLFPALFVSIIEEG